MRFKPRFSLQKLLVFVAALALPMAWFGWQASIVRHRLAMLRRIESECGPLIRPFNTVGQEHDVRVYYDDAIPSRFSGDKSPWYRTMFGDKRVPIICVPHSTSDNEIAEIEDMFPEAHVTKYPVIDDARKASLIEKLDKGNTHR